MTITTAANLGAVKPADFEWVTVDTTVQEKAVACPNDSRLLELAWRSQQQKRSDKAKDKVLSLHAPDVECIGKGKARQP